MQKYFFDTYALVALVKNNPNYIKYSDEFIITTQYNLIELYYIILKDFSEEVAIGIYKKFKESITQINDEIIFKAMKLKLKNKNLSYVDCIGYTCSINNNLKFLTGDKEFEHMENVEFVK